uniref:Uncharacterized protein n=1 Tax=Melanopsichium pennsylvanicum 4 TaxID=1398559 RepID=A0A077RC57_9BASI|nr:conserved hypothetical protein [Melanopsichium pennsylvanicum 4]
MIARKSKLKESIQKYFGRQAELLCPWWTTVTFLEGFTGIAHMDKVDHQPSFLFNFFAPCLLVLHNYNLKVEPDCLDIAIFVTHSLVHSTHAVAGQGQVRQAFVAFFRQSI